MFWNLNLFDFKQSLAVWIKRLGINEAQLGVGAVLLLRLHFLHDFSFLVCQGLSKLSLLVLSQSLFAADAFLVGDKWHAWLRSLRMLMKPNF